MNGNPFGASQDQVAVIMATLEQYAQGMVAAQAQLKQAAAAAAALIQSTPGAVSQAGIDPSQTANALTSLANSNQLNDDSLLESLGNQASSLLSQSPNLGNGVDMVWQGCLQGLKEGAMIGASVAALDVALTEIGLTALSDILAALVAEIAALIAEALAAMGLSTVVAGTVAGASTFGYVGAIIGAIIGAIVALVEYLVGGPHVQITNGNTYSDKDYVQNNLKTAAEWLTNNQDKILGLTPLHFANQANIFIANPTWLWINQSLLGITQPTPPDQATKSPTDLIYTQLPGAFELLNRAQYMAAIGLVNSTPQHLDFYMSIPQPGDVYPSTDPSRYQPILPPVVITWGLGEPYQAGVIYGGSQGNWSRLGFLYTSCPNLMTNDCIIGPDGKVQAQTNVSPGIYALQMLYPALTKQQCDKIFKACSNAYSNSVNLLPPNPPLVPMIPFHPMRIAPIHGGGGGGSAPSAPPAWTMPPSRFAGSVGSVGGSAARPVVAPKVSPGHFTTNPPPPSKGGAATSSAAPIVVAGAAASLAFALLGKK